MSNSVFNYWCLFLERYQRAVKSGVIVAADLLGIMWGGSRRQYILFLEITDIPYQDSVLAHNVARGW